MKSKPLALVLACSSLGLTAASRCDAAGLLIADGGLGGMLELKEHTVHVAVNNGIVTTTVDQVFLNTESRPVEGLYTFPVPRGASVSNFSMWIGGKEMVGEVVEKQRAREIYNSYKARKQDPGLLEQVDYRTFEMRVFPIAAKGEQHVRVTYAQELNFDADAATYVYPLATSTRPGVNSKVTGKFALTVDAKSEIPIVAMDSPSHAQAFAFADHGPNYRQASLEARGGDLSRDVVLSFQTKRPRTGLDLVTSRSGGEDGYFMLTLTAGDELAQVNTSADYVFVIDSSGSMADDRKLATSTRAVEELVRGLGSQDRFEVVTFNVQNTPLFGTLTPATPQSVQAATAFLGSREARGGTILSRAVGAAYKLASPERPLNVVILSDGLTEQSETDQLGELIRKRPKGSRVFAVGVGNDVNRPLLERIADGSGGLAAFLSGDDDLARQAAAFRRKLLRPVASNVEIKLSGIDAYDVLPAKPVNLYHGQPVRIYGRYRKPGLATVAVSGSIQDRPLAQSVSFDFPKEDASAPEIERMWATRKVDTLLKEADDAGSRQSVIPEVIRLGEGYSIVTEYTSFLVLENDLEYQRWKIDRKNALRIERDRAAQKRTATELAKLRDAESDQLGPDAVQLISAPNPDAVAVPSAPGAGSSPSPAFNAAPSANRTSSPRSRDLGGGGAIDPVSAIVLLGLGSVGTLTRARRR